MCGHCIIGKRVAFFAEVKVTFVHFEEQLYVPTFSIDPDDFVLIQIYVRGNKAESSYLDLPPLFLFLL